MLIGDAAENIDYIENIENVKERIYIQFIYIYIYIYITDTFY